MGILIQRSIRNLSSFSQNHEGFIHSTFQTESSANFKPSNQTKLILYFYKYISSFRLPSLSISTIIDYISFISNIWRFEEIFKYLILQLQIFLYNSKIGNFSVNTNIRVVLPLCRISLYLICKTDKNNMSLYFQPWR